MSVTVQFVELCWLILVLYWIVTAFSVKRVKERFRPRGWLRLPIICVLVYVIISARHGWALMGARCLPDTLAVRIIGDVIVLLGLVIAIWARTILGGNWSASVTFKEDHELIERGPYRFVRHPIYTGILVMTFGTAIIIGRVAALVALIFLVVIYWLRALREEELLTRHFPEAYPAYKTRTKALIPFLF